MKPLFQALRPGLAGLLALLLATGPGGAAAQASAPTPTPAIPATPAAPAALDILLRQLERLGYNEPLDALLGLRHLRADPAHAHASAQVQIDYAIGRVLANIGEADQALQQAQSLQARPGGAPLAELLRAEVLEHQGQAIKAGELADQALKALRPACPVGAPAGGLPADCQWRAAWHGLRLVSRAQSARGEVAFAETTMRQALALAQAAPDPYLSGQAMASLALLGMQTDQPAAAQQWLAQAWQVSQGDALAMLRVKMFEAMLSSQRGDRKTQQQALLDALKLGQQAGARREVSQVLNNLADSYMHQGQPARAAAAAREALPVVLEFRDQRMERTLRHNLAVALLQQRQLDAARREMARVNELVQGNPDGQRRSNELRELGMAHAQIGQHREALRLYHEERNLSAATAQRNRESSLQQLRLKYDSEAKQRDLELLKREQTLKRQELDNRRLAQYVGAGLAALLVLSLVLVVVMLARVRGANKRLKANQSLLRAQSERDPLTDLANRRHFLAVMERHARQVFKGALLMIDIDHFKHVNDRHGHAAGDAVICEVARRISQAVRQDDLVVRWGGEEFLVFAHDVAPDQLQLLAERILYSVGLEPVATQGGPLRVTCSIGFAHFPLPPAELALHWEQAVNWADMALYTAKAQGRNRARGIVTVQAGDAQALLQIEADFDAACSSERVQLQTILGPDGAA